MSTKPFCRQMWQLKFIYLPRTGNLRCGISYGSHFKRPMWLRFENMSVAIKTMKERNLRYTSLRVFLSSAHSKSSVRKNWNVIVKLLHSISISQSQIVTLYFLHSRTTKLSFYALKLRQLSCTFYTVTRLNCCWSNCYPVPRSST